MVPSKFRSPLLMREILPMFKIVIVFVGILWASLVLISWGSDVDSRLSPVQSSLTERSES
jgi:hypothetical protein